MANVWVNDKLYADVVDKLKKRGDKRNANNLVKDMLEQWVRDEDMTFRPGYG